jgi:HSP20 family protein
VVSAFKPMIAPLVSIDHDRERYKIQIELPGVKKEDIDLEVSENSFRLRAVRRDAEMAGCYFLAFPVEPDGTDAAFDKGMLNLEIPLKVPIKGKHIKVREGPNEIEQESGRDIEIKEGIGSLGTGTQ